VRKSCALAAADLSLGKAPTPRAGLLAAKRSWAPATSFTGLFVSGVAFAPFTARPSES
jgi:hypothetical protein